MEEKDMLDIISLFKGVKEEIEEGPSYFGMRKKIGEEVKKMKDLNENFLEKMHNILKTKDELNYLFALAVIKKTKSKNSVPYLIDFIKNNEGGDYSLYCDEAGFALKDIGELAANSLLNEIKLNFDNKKYFGYLVGALITIKNEEVYSFMKEVLNSYLENSEKYDGWFRIDGFIHGFVDQGHKEILPSLKKLLDMEHFSEHERIEIEDAIERLENPEKDRREFDEESKIFKKYLNLKKDDIDKESLLDEAIKLEDDKKYGAALSNITKVIAVYPDDYYTKLIGARIERKMGKPNAVLIDNVLKEAKKQKANKRIIKEISMEREKIIELFQEKQFMNDDNFELNFRCLKCGKRQNIRPGQIWQIGTEENLSYDNEIMCKYCFRHEMEITLYGRMSLIGLATRMLSGNGKGFLQTDEEIYVEDKKMHFSKATEYLLRRIMEEPANGELYLRTANNFRKFNEYEKATEYYEKAMILNPKLIAAYVNLVEIYQHRYKYYNVGEAREKAIEYRKKMARAFKNQDYNTATLKEPDLVVNFLGEKSEELGINIEKEIGGSLIKIKSPNFENRGFEQKIGRNDPCPCGSGKKYKRCCLKL